MPNVFTGRRCCNNPWFLTTERLGDTSGTTINGGGSIYIHNVIATDGTISSPSPRTADRARSVRSPTALVTVLANSTIQT
jgi:hypothetical protein